MMFISLSGIIILCLLAYTVGSSDEDKLKDNPILILREKVLKSPECGKGWQSEYQRLHSNIRDHDGPVRFFVVGHDGQGANDRLTAMITGFYAALLTNRAYFLTAHNDAPEFQIAFDMSMVNFTLNDTWKDRIQKHYVDYIKYPGLVKVIARDSLSLYDPKRKDINETMSIIYGDTPIIWFNSNRGYSYHLIHDSIYGQPLRDYGINPVYGFTCAFHYLFRPNMEVLNLASPYTDYFKDKSTIKIGIQIRTGDDKMYGNYQLFINSSHYYQNFFNCAKYLEETRLKEEHPNKKVLWYVMSDSLSLKKDVKRVYGDKIITNIDKKPEHSGRKNRLKVHLGLQLIFSEQLTMSLCDYYIISHDSHVGRIAIWFSEYGASRNHSYFEHRNSKIESKAHYCKQVPSDYVLADNGAGI